jgi:single-strand DNA-binding protein
MAEGLNRVMLLGNLGADPELRVTPGGQAVLKLRLATNESYVDRNNVRQERTEWHRVTVWGRRAEALGKILQKGDSLFVEGRLQTSSYEKKGRARRGRARRLERHGRRHSVLMRSRLRGPWPPLLAKTHPRG